MPSVAALNKENRAPAGGSFALTGKTTAASKRAAASTKRPAASSSKIRKPSTTDTFADAEDEDDDELMMAGAGGEEGETVIVGETQFAQDGEGEEDDEEVEEVVPKKGARGAKKPAAGGAKGRATKKAASGTDASLTDDFDAALAIPLASMEGAGAKPSAREKKLEAQLAATKKALSESQALFAKLSELRETRAEEAEQRLREISDERIKFSTLRTELNAEVAHSKSLQQQLKSAPSTSSSAVLPLPAAPSTSAATPTDTLKLQDEIERLTQKLNLNEDLTGFAVHSVKQEEMGATYVCLLSDCAGTTGALNFKLTFHPDGTTSYKPNLEAERDAALVQLLSPELQGYMRFGAEMSSEFFKRLFASVNKVRI
ncbi:hypothetical protein NBRC10513v2_002563 [Rhodotorula toruloides]